MIAPMTGDLDHQAEAIAAMRKAVAATCAAERLKWLRAALEWKHLESLAKASWQRETPRERPVRWSRPGAVFDHLRERGAEGGLLQSGVLRKPPGNPSDVWPVRKKNCNSRPRV